MDNNYSNDGREPYPALGLIALAEHNLRMPIRGVSSAKQIERKRRASKALVHAIRAIEREIMAAETKIAV
jgi:hypothetical protein